MMYGLRSRTGFWVAVLAIAFVSLATLATSPTAAAAEPGPNARAIERVMEVQDRHTGRLMALPGVVGTATGVDPAGKPVVKVFTVQAGIAGIPANLEGERVVVEATGPFFALASPPGTGKPPKDEGPALGPTSRWPSPVPIGVSIGNEFSCSAGTIGCRVRAGVDSYALSNVHVFDPWHYGIPPDAVEYGERIVQPGRIDDPADDCSDKATPQNIIGKVVDSVPIDFGGGDNYVDAAIAIIPMDPGDYPPEQADPRMLGNSTPPDGYGTPSSLPVTAALGQKVQKYGRTTGLTKGQVTAVNATINIEYDLGRARFVDQIIVESGKPFIRAGDSGSLLVTQSGNNPTGLLFAGNWTGKMAVANHIVDVLLAFGVLVDGK